MKKSLLIFLSLLILVLLSTSVMAEDEVSAVYGETYMCGNAYTMRIVAQPQMMAQTSEKLNFYVIRLDQQTHQYKPYQVNVRYAQQTEEDVLLVFRIQLRNLNAKTISGLSKNSFILTGKVRDRIIEYKPEVMMPFTMSVDEWFDYFQGNDTFYYLNRVIPDTITFDVSKYWNPLLMSERSINAMRILDIRLIYRVPSWLAGWDLHVNPQAVKTDSSLKTCELVLHLPSIMNEITRETYKYF